MEGHHSPDPLPTPDHIIARAISELAHSVDALVQLVNSNQAVLGGIAHLESIIMATVKELIDAGTLLSTAADGLSARADKLIASADRVVAALQNVPLPPEADAAVAALKADAAATGAEGDKVDAEVTKLDAILPTPAPPGPTP